MKSLLFVFITLLCITASAQDTSYVYHNAYNVVWCKSSHIPVLVYYKLRGSDITCATKIARTNNFKADPAMPGTNLSKDYSHSGYDQGHNMSADDNQCNATAMNECFYYTNMFPQLPSLNRGIWKQLEVLERKEARTDDSISVFIGSYGMDKTIGPDKVVVPAYCWKAIYDWKSHLWTTYIFPNTGVCKGNLSTYTNFTPEQYHWMLYCILKYTGFSVK